MNTESPLQNATNRWTADLPRHVIETGNRIDRLMTLEIRPLQGGVPHGIVVPMYEVCRAHQRGPLSVTAGAALVARVPLGGTIFIATGAGVAPKLPVGETDGPVGAASLALALAKGLDARVVLVTEDAHRVPVEAAQKLVNAKLRLWADATAHTTVTPVEVESFSPGLESGRTRSVGLMRQYKPAAIIFVERDGPNVEGHFHGVRGDCRDPEGVGHVYLLADDAKQAGILTVGIGDGGNEVGFGAMRESIRDVLPNRGASLAGHASGVVTVVETDVTVSASVSNWGAHAVVGALAVLLGNREVLHDAATEHELIAVTMAAGARDGASSKQSMDVDGIEFQGHLAFVSLLATVARVAIPPSP